MSKTVVISRVIIKMSYLFIKPETHFCGSSRKTTPHKHFGERWFVNGDKAPAQRSFY